MIKILQKVRLFLWFHQGIAVFSLLLVMLAASADAAGPATAALTVRDAAKLTLTPTILASGTQGATYSQVLSASGGVEPYSYAITSGALPNGLLLYGSTGTISGTPSDSGEYSMTVTVMDAGGLTARQHYSLQINGLEVPVAGAANATVAANSSANGITLNLSGGAASSVAVASKPSYGTATASGIGITYTPTAGYSGSDTFSYTATNARGTSNQATVSITVSSPILDMAPSTLPNGIQGMDYNHSLSASGGTAPYSYAITAGTLSTDLSLNASSGLISGTLLASDTISFTVTATDANGATGSHAYSVAVTAPVAESVPLPGNAGSASVLITSSQAGCMLEPGSLRISASGIPNPPADASFPVGVLFFSAIGCAGAKIQVQVDYPVGALAGLTMRKYGPHGLPPMQLGWFTPADLSVNGNSVSYSVTDDGEGDNQTTIPGMITDPFAPMLLAAPAQSHAIPTISEWGLIILSALMLMLGLARMWRRQV